MKKVTLGILLSALNMSQFLRRAEAYSSSGHAWGVTTVPYYVNPANAHGLSAANIVNDLQQADAIWTTQGGINTSMQYMGTTSSNVQALDYQNNIFFRNPGNGLGAWTYWFYDGTGHLVDFDMYFEGGPYFTGSSGCSGAGIYLSEIAAHEFGHAFGLDHSDSPPGNTMQSLLPGYCTMVQLTLEADDIAGIQSLYPLSTQPPPSACDINADGSKNALDVQLMTNQAIGVSSCSADINHDGLCNVIDVQRVVNAVLGGACATN